MVRLGVSTMGRTSCLGLKHLLVYSLVLGKSWIQNIFIVIPVHSNILCLLIAFSPSYICIHTCLHAHTYRSYIQTNVKYVKCTLSLHHPSPSLSLSLTHSHKPPCLSLIVFQHGGWHIITYFPCANLQQCPHVNYEVEEHLTQIW